MSAIWYICARLTPEWNLRRDFISGDRISSLSEMKSLLILKSRGDIISLWDAPAREVISYICIHMHRDCDLGIIGNLNLKELPYMRSRGDKISNTLEIFGRNITLGHRPGGAQLPRISCLELRGGNLPGRLLNHASWEFRNGKASMGQVDAM